MILIWKKRGSIKKQEKERTGKIEGKEWKRWEEVGDKDADV